MLVAFVVIGLLAFVAYLLGPAGWVGFALLIVLLCVWAAGDAARRERLNTAISDLVQTHLEALRTKRFQLVTYDAYGNVLLKAWHKEIAYFANKVLLPELETDYKLSDGPLETIATPIIDQALGPLHERVPSTMSPLDFEAECADAARLCGWNARTTKGSGDQGVDVIAEKDGVRVVFQCKLYSKPVGNKAVQEITAGKAFEQAQFAAVVSNVGYTPAAKQLASSTNVALLHPSEINTYLSKLVAQDA